MGFEFLSNGREEGYYSFIERIKALKKINKSVFYIDITKSRVKLVIGSYPEFLTKNKNVKKM